jgi:hypothetical protein
MKALLYSILALTLTACASGGPAPDEENDAFIAAAKSWVGGSVDDMIAAWGTPHRCAEYESSDKPGSCYWRASSLSGRTRCTITAYSDPDGTINDIRVTTRLCDQHFGDRLAALTR